MSKCKFQSKSPIKHWVHCNKRLTVNPFTGLKNQSQELPVFECKHCPDNPANQSVGGKPNE